MHNHTDGYREATLSDQIVHRNTCIAKEQKPTKTIVAAAVAAAAIAAAAIVAVAVAAAAAAVADAAIAAVAIRAPQYVRRNTCIAIRASQYARRNTCIAIRASQYVHRRTCVTIHASQYMRRIVPQTNGRQSCFGPCLLQSPGQLSALRWRRLSLPARPSGLPTGR